MQQPKDAPGSATPALEARHQASGLNSRFNGDRLPFADYVARTRDMITEAHRRMGASHPERAVAGNAPFELTPAAGYPTGQNKPYRRGILLTHGLTDSPYFMRYLAAFFQQNGFRVMAMLLPGHGTRPGDLLEVDWREWAKAVAYGADRLADEVDELYLGGFSAGGALSVYQSLSDKRVKGLFLFSPAFSVTPWAAWAWIHKLYSWLIPAAKWVAISPDKSLYKYESLTKNAASQIHALLQALHSRLQKREVNIPIFAAASQDDATANTPATLEFMAHVRHPCSKLVLYTTDPEKFPPNIPAERVELVHSVVPEQNILSSAHTAVVLPPDDPHYGAAGDYTNAIHYYPDDMEKYEACNGKTGKIFLGEITETNLQAGTLRRLMYNPNFEALKVSMKRFIDGLP